MIRVIRDISKV